MSLRETKEAISFRIWLKEIQSDLTSGDRVRIQNAAKKALSVDKYFEEWSKEIDPSYGFTKTKRIVKLGKIPVVGWLFDLCNVDNINIDDPILTAPEKHLAFFARMYSEVHFRNQAEMIRDEMRRQLLGLDD
jgi:hypothetical protein